MAEKEDGSRARDGSPDSHEDPKTPKQGGATAWLLVLGGFFVFFTIWGIPLSFGIFQDYYTLNRLKGYSPSAVSWIGTFQNFILVFVGVFGGPLYDLGHYPLLICVGAFLSVFGLMMISVSTQYYQLFLSHFCNGLGGGLLYVPTLTVVAQAHNKTRPVAMGIMASGIALGGVIYTIMFLKLEPSLDFGWAVRIMAFLALASYMVALPALFMGPRQKRGGTARALVDRSAFTDSKFIMFAVGQMCTFWGYLPPCFYLSIYAQVRVGTSQATSYYLLVALQGASLLGRMAAALAGTYLGAMLPWIVCAAGSGILSLAWIAITDLNSLVAFSVIFGFISGGLMVLPPAIFPVLCPRKETMGTRLGMSWAFTSIATLTGGPIAGAIVDLQSIDFVGMQVWSGVLLLLGAALLSVLWLLLARSHKKVLI